MRGRFNLGKLRFLPLTGRIDDHKKTLRSKTVGSETIVKLQFLNVEHQHLDYHNHQEQSWYVNQCLMINH